MLLILDVKNGEFADMDKIRPINLAGDYVTSRGPLPIPPSKQGQPVIFTAGGGEEALEISGRMLLVSTRIRMIWSHHAPIEKIFGIAQNDSDVTLMKLKSSQDYPVHCTYERRSVRAPQTT